MGNQLDSELLIELGLRETTAAIVSYLSTGEPASLREISSSAEIELSRAASGLRQCRFRGWVNSDESPSLGRGRPSRRWSLIVSHLELLHELELEIRQQHLILNDAIRNVERSLANLREPIRAIQP